MDAPPAPSSVLIVSCWMGPLPPYLPLFLGSCRANPTVSFLVPSDQPAPPGLPPNVHFVPLTLDGFNARASAALGTPVHVADGYKLCDFKPTLGVFIADEIGPADFWGFCDLDLVWGDLRAFLTEDFLSGVDVASFRGPWWISGALSLFRTASAATRLYERIPGWQALLADPPYRGIDEAAGRFDGVEHPVEALVAGGATVSFTDVAREADAAGDLRLRTPEWIAEPSTYWAPFEYRWHHGALTDLMTGDARMFCHFVRTKHEPFCVLDAWPDLPETFYFTPTGTTTVPPDRRLRRAAHNARRRVQRLPAAGVWYARKLRHRLSRRP